MISFIIPTTGQRKDSLNALLESIMMQKIHDVEIIIVGPCDFRPMGAIHLPANYETNNGLLSSKLNMGCAVARHYILMPIHDDMMLHENFFEWLKFDGWIDALFNRSVDILAPNYIYPLISDNVFKGVVQTSNDHEEYPLGTIGGPKGHRGISLDEWDSFSYVSGEAMILTAPAWARCNWENNNDHRLTRGTIECYDVVFGRKANEVGLNTGFDPRVALYHHRIKSHFVL